MDFDQMLETWRAQNTAPPYDLNRDALRQALKAEEARVETKLRTERRSLWGAWIIGTGMAVFAGFWIAITITNGWPAIYAIAAGASLSLFAVGVGALWMGRWREPKRKFGNTLDEEARRNLALVDYQLSGIRRWIFSVVGGISILVGAGLLSWTINRSQGIPDSSPGNTLWFTVVIAGVLVWLSCKDRDEMRKAREKLEFRQRRLRELLASLEARE